MWGQKISHWNKTQEVWDRKDSSRHKYSRVTFKRNEPRMFEEHKPSVATTARGKYRQNKVKERVNRECPKEAVRRGSKLRREDAPGNRNLGAPRLKQTYRKHPES